MPPFVTKTWYDAPNPLTPLNAAALNDLEARIDALAGRVYSVRDFGAVGNGTTDDSAAINAAIVAAADDNMLLIGHPGDNYAISSTINVATEVEIDWCGSTITKNGSTNITAVNVTGANVRMEGLHIEGNKTTADGWGLIWTGAGGTLRDSVVKNCRFTGVSVSAGGVLDCYNVTSSNNGSVAATAHGFLATTSGLMRLYQCRAEFNTYIGFFCTSLAADACHIDGYAHRNRLGADFRSDNGTVGELIVEDNDNFGVEWYDEEAAFTITGWNCDYILAKNNGDTSGDPSATGVELYSTSNSHFGTIISIGNNGYGLALGRACNDNYFGNVSCNGAGSVDSDPGILIGASSRNVFGSVSVKNHTFAVSMGEDVVGANNDNEVQQLYAYQISHGVLRIQQSGSRNHFGSVVARNCTTLDTANWPALVNIYGATTETTIESIAHKTTTTAPAWVLYMASPDNVVNAIHGASGSVGRVNDTGLRNRVGWTEEKTFTDSGSVDFFKEGLWFLEAFYQGTNQPIGHATVSMTIWSDGSNKRKISVLTSHGGWSAGTLTFTAVGADTTGGVVRVTTAAGSGGSVLVRYTHMPHG